MTSYPPQHADFPTVVEVPSHDTDTSDDAKDVKEKAAASAEAGKQAAADVAQTAADKAKDVAQEAGQQTRKVLSEAQGQLQDHAREQQRNAVTNLRSLADELSSMADRSEQQGLATDVVSQAGSRVGTVATWLDDRQPGELVDEVRRFARQRPGVFLLGALAAGVLAGRLTRGVVAVHKDNAADDDSGASAASQPATTTVASPVVPAAPVRP